MGYENYDAMDERYLNRVARLFYNYDYDELSDNREREFCIERVIEMTRNVYLKDLSSKSFR